MSQSFLGRIRKLYFPFTLFFFLYSSEWFPRPEMAWGSMRIAVGARPAYITSTGVGVAVSSCGQLPATARAADQSRLCPGHLPATESSLTHITLVTLLPSMPAVLPQGDPLHPQPDVLPTRH